MARKNRLTDLNDHLFMALEALGDEGLPPEETELRIRKAAAVVGVSDAILRIADTRIKAAKTIADIGAPGAHMLGELTFNGASTDK